MEQQRLLDLLPIDLLLLTTNDDIVGDAVDQMGAMDLIQAGERAHLPHRRRA
jgi:hypothetical protein